MAILVGNNGSIVLASTTYCGITEWTVTVETDRPEVTEIKSQVRQYGRGLTKGYGSFVSLDHIDYTEYPYDIAAVFNTTVVALDNTSVNGNIQITKSTARVSVEGIINWTYEFIFNGGITIT